MNPLTSRTVPAGDAHYDVAIAGAGLGGIAAAIYMRQAGARVMCVEPEPFPHERVGESLDWSAPALLKALGVSCEEIVAEQIGIYKKKIRLFPLGKPEFDGGPHEWFQKPPLRFEVTTLHVDRVGVDQKLFERAQSLGVEFIWDRVTSVVQEGPRVVGLQTAQHGPINATWFLDASGQGRVFAKAMRIGKSDYGRRKVCMWTYFKTDTHYEGTTFYGDDMAEYLSWIWEIPIAPHRISVGCIMPADELENLRRGAKSVKSILHGELAKYPRFAPLLAEQADAPVRTTSFRCYVSERVCGENWALVGEAAALPDPLTGNGFTAALRHAKEASEFIRESFRQGAFTKEQMLVYDTNVRRMGHAFNYGIETCAYESTMRRGVGSIVAMTVYTAFGYLVNALYAKFNPQTPVATARFAWFFRINKAWMKFWEWVARVLLGGRRLLARPSPGRRDTMAAR